MMSEPLPVEPLPMSFNQLNSKVRFFEARSWKTIVREAEHCVGKKDAQAWLENMQELLNHPRFKKDPIPLKAKFPKIEQPIACPHPQASSKLGYFRVYYPDGMIREVFGENEVKEILLSH